ncbi:MAG: hypothetical protein ACRCX2_08340 [Paraclostridium sp.]
MIGRDKIVVKSDFDYAVRDAVETEITTEVKKVVDEMSVKYMRNIQVTVRVDVD